MAQGCTISICPGEKDRKGGKGKEKEEKARKKGVKESDKAELERGKM